MSQRTPPTTPWLAGTPSDSRADVRLFCLPYAGSGVAMYRPWARLLPTGVELCPILLPGRESRFREPACTDLRALSAEIADALGPWLDRPFALFGHSMGAWIAFELARELRRRHGEGPARLFASARMAPHLPQTETPIHGLPEPQFIDDVERRYGPLPAVIRNDAELLRLFLPTLRADLEAVATYTYLPEPPLQCPITAFGGTDDSRAGRDVLEAWRDQTTGSFRLAMVPGGHFFLQSARELLLQEISADLLSFLRRPPAADRAPRHQPDWP